MQFLLAGIFLANFSQFHSEKDCLRGANVSPDPLQILIVLNFFVEEGSEQMQRERYILENTLFFWG